MKIGHGYDAHSFASNRSLILGGENIEYEYGLQGHSDADVLVHAIMDCLLGAAGFNDIGSLFPNNDDKYKDISSLTLLNKVNKLLIENKFKIINIDSTIIAEEPKLFSYILKMKLNVALKLNIDVSNINIKATTEDGLGFTGKKHGIAAHAVCLINQL